MKSFIQLLNPHSGDLYPSLLVHFDSQRYLFNCGEGTQRLINEYRIRLGKLRDIFITRLHWDCVGGLPGLALTLADATAASNGQNGGNAGDGMRHGLRIHGPRNTTHFFNSTRHFINRKQFPLDTREFGMESTILAKSRTTRMGDKKDASLFFRDDNLTVHVVPLRPRGGGDECNLTESGSVSSSDSGQEMIGTRKRKVSKTVTNIGGGDGDSQARWPRQFQLEKEILGCIFQAPPSLAGEINNSGQSEADYKPSPINHRRLPNTRPDYTSLCYLCDGPSIPPKFDQQRATQLGIPKGPDRARLVRGETITLLDGRDIRPEDVCSPGRPSTAFMVIDLPSLDYLDPLMESEMITEFASNNRLGCVIHMVADEVVESERYRQWLNERFQPHCQHIICSPRFNGQSVLFRSAAIQQFDLHRIEPTAYLIPFGQDRPRASLDQFKEFSRPTVVAGKALLRFEMEPQPSRLNHEDCPPPLPMNKQRMANIPLAYPPRDSGDDGGVVSDITVQFLGTGSMTPSKYRNVSGISLTFGDRGHFLMDTGEGSLGQLFRMYGGGDGGLADYLRSLRGIFISHLHADHHLGLVRLIQEYGKINYGHEKLDIIGPKGLWSFLREFNQCQPLRLKETIRFTDANTLWYAGKQPAGVLNELKQKLQLQHVATFPVIHCPQAYGVYLMTDLQMNNGGKDGEREMAYGITYSGDTRPCDDLVEASIQHAAVDDILLFPSCPLRSNYHGLLIHEATFGDDMQQDAIDRRHSTTGEAIEMAKRMRAKELLLTHFSQRYPKVDDAQQHHAHSDDQLAIGAAVDMMQVRVGDVARRLAGHAAQTTQIISLEIES